MHVAITFKQAFRMKDRIWRTMLKRTGVTGIGVGFADPRKPSKGAAVIVYTLKKLSAQAESRLLKATGRLTAASSVPFRIIRSGAFKEEAAAPKQTGPRQRWRPMPGAVSVGTTVPVSAGGTGGLIVIKDRRLFILSNAHVLAPDNTTVFHNTIQPSPADGGTTSDQIGRLFQYVQRRPTGVNFQDSAIAIANTDSLLNPRYLINEQGSLITVPGHLLSYPVGRTFKRMAKTTGFARGVVEAIGVERRVTGSLGTLLYRNQTVIRITQGRTAAGDSGSVWLNDTNTNTNNYAAAVHFAGSSDGLRSISFPIERAMASYGTLVAIPAAGQGFKAGKVGGRPPKNNYAYTRPTAKRELPVRVVHKRGGKA
jgi:hypothetical protein